MKKLFLTFIFLFLLSVLYVKAQQTNTIITGQISGIVCKGATILVPFSTTGTFESGNIFTVQIKTSAEKNWTNLVSDGTENPLKTSVPANYNPDDYNNSTPYYIRVVASKPNIIGKESLIPLIYSKPQIELFGATLTTINPYNLTTLKFRGTGSSPIQIVLNDSSKVTIPYSISPNSDFYSESITSIFPLKSGNYTIAYSENICGRSSGTGGVAITVNQIGLKVLRPENTTVCIGGLLRVPYSTDGRKMNVDNKFKVRLGYSNTITSEIELDAVEKDGFVEARIPENFQTGGYYVNLMSSSPVAKSSYPEQINIQKKSFADFQPQSITINWGQEIYLPLNVSLNGPWSITFSDGSIIGNTEGTSSGRFLKVKPEKSIIYSLSSLTDQCGVGSVGNSKFEVTVKSGVVIDSLQQVEVCVGGNFSAKYSTNGNVNISTLSAVLQGRAKGYTINVPATFENGMVNVSIPQTFFSDTSYSDVEYSLGIKYNNVVSYSENYVRIKNKPNVSFVNTNPVNIESTGIATLPILVTGSSPLTVQLDDLSNFSFNDINLNYVNKVVQFPVQVLKPSIFRLKSISNSCGTTSINDGKIITVNVKNKSTFGITINNAETRICTGSKMKVSFNTLGEFGFDNNFKVELFRYNYDRLDNAAVVIGEGKTSPIEVTIPANYEASEVAYLRVSSNNPNAVSEFKQISINTKPVFTFNYDPYPFNNNVINLMVGEKLFIGGDRKAGLLGSNVFTFSDGTILLEDTKYGYSSVRYTRTFTQSTVFGLNSVSNECGQGTILRKSFNVNVIPYLIVNVSPRIYNKTYCTGENITYTYNFTRKPEKEDLYNLQIVSTKDSIFTDLSSKTTENPVIVRIPMQFKTGTYFIRLINSNNPKIASDWTLITIDSPITVNLSTFDDKNLVTTESGNPVTLKYNYSNKSVPSFVTISDEFNNTYNLKVYNSDYDRAYTQIIYSKKPSTFTIKSVENACGYGVGSGSVKIITTPTLTIEKPSSNIICVGGNLKLKYAATENYPADNIFKFALTYTGYIDNIPKTVRYELGQTNQSSGEITLKIPTDILILQYQLEVTSSNPNSVKIYNDITFIASQLPDVTVSGGTTIISGSGTYLNMVNNARGSSWYILSDSTQGRVFYSKIYVPVSPSKTTTYKILSAYNECGVGKFSGSATITVNPASEKKVYANFDEFNKFPEQYPYICAGATYTIEYKAFGEFSPSNKFTVQVSDENGENFKDVVTEGTSSPLKFITPDDMKPSSSYRIRVVASDKDVSSGSNYAPLIFSRKGPTAMFDSSTYLFTEGKTISIKINLTGRSPWTLKFGIDEATAKYYQGITDSPYIINVSPIKPATYKIFGVYDGCPGKVMGSNTVLLELITANEDLSDFEVKLFPNPTSDKITIQSDNFKNTTLQITDILGRQILQQNINKSETVLDISNFKTGQYLLQIERGDKRLVYKVGKL
jgi:hypothetical protein